jgi:hypothetical protein
MLPSDDDWPDFEWFHPGSAKHLHAVGVISSCYNAFERILYDLYFHHLDKKKLPRKFAEFQFFALNEQDRMAAIRNVFILFERRKRVVHLIDNLVTYFNWAWTARNSILHGEVYPTAIVSSTDLNLIKRRNKRSADVGYLSLTLDELRYIAERIEDGRLQAAKINVHLRYRDRNRAQRNAGLRAYHEAGLTALPRRLSPPDALALSERPHTGPLSQYLRRSAT